jgi:pimeloyl-ACP methyl ester carboxylesterase
MDAFTCDLASGRTIGVTEFGDRDAQRVVVLVHPAPGSSFFDPDPVVTASHRVRMIAVDRPGYGNSAIAPNDAPTVRRAAADIAEYLESEGIGGEKGAASGPGGAQSSRTARTIGIAGWSAGGRVALALAAAHPDLVDRVAVVATPAPDSEVPWVGEEHRAMLESLRHLPPNEAIISLAAMFDEFMGAEPPPEQMVDAVVTAGVDDSARAEAYDRLLGMMRGAVAQGNLGMAADIVGYTLLDWGFEPRDVAAPTLLLYGDKDPEIGHVHADWYHRHLPNSWIETVPDAGHLVLIPEWDRVLSHLAPGSNA